MLDKSASGALSVSGSGFINLPGPIYVNSSSSGARLASGSAQIGAQNIEVAGGVSRTGGATISGTLVTGAAPVADLLASLTGPITSGLTNYGSVSYSSGLHPLSAGIYSQISASGNASLVLGAGLYLIEGGGFTVTGNASVSGSGVTIYNTSSNYPGTGSYGGITLSGKGRFSLTAATTATAGAYPES